MYNNKVIIIEKLNLDPDETRTRTFEEDDGGGEYQ